ncbi:MAG TPA: hypothetical protein VMU29_09240 [Smithella sp.]|nr:hypothetical protein [Smithella sp.]
MTEKEEKLEVYRLWWEYLKRSEQYKEFCKNYSNLGKDLYGPSHEVFLNYLIFFGNIFEKSFDDWRNESLRKNGGLPGSRPVLDLRDKESYSRMYFKSLVNWDNNSQSLPNEKQIWEIINYETQYIFLAVPVVGREDMKMIAKQIKRLRDKYKKTTTVKEADKEIRKFRMTSTRLISNELKYYLKVYDYRRKGLSMAEVIKEMAPGENCKDMGVQDKFYRFQRYATKIIKNVEKGTFPGKYLSSSE